MAVDFTRVDSSVMSRFADSAIYNNGSDINVSVIINHNLEKFNNLGVSENVTGITFQKSVINKPRRGATVTIGSDIYTLGEILEDDGISVLMEATK